jgi:putative inorganic carbon (HCO3(-)) transporter
VAFLVFWGLVFISNRQEWKKILRPFLIFTFSFLLLTFYFGRDWVPGIKKFFPKDNQQSATSNQQTAPNNQQTSLSPPLLISESGDIRKVVWRGAVEIWRHYPLFGTGPETFAYSYYWFRPREHNDLSEWDFLYNKAHNEYLNYAATTGTIGLVAYLLLIGSFLFWSVKKIPNSKFQIPNKSQILNSKSPKKLGQLEIGSIRNFLLPAFFSGFLSIAVTNFFGFSVVPVQLLFFLFPAFSFLFQESLTSPSKIEPKKLTKWDTWEKLSIWQKGIILGILLFIFYFLIFNFKYWRADTYFSSGEKLNKAGYYDQAFNSLQQAIKLRDFEPIYHDEIAWSAANLAVLTKDQGATLSGQFAELALKESDKALKTSPYNLNFWKTRAKIGFKLVTLEPKYYQIALQALLRGTELAPTEPKIKYNLALVYLTLGQSELATKTLEETIQLKPNYEDPRYALALIYEQAGKKQKAREQLEYILNHINPVSQKAKEKLESF